MSKKEKCFVMMPFSTPDNYNDEDHFKKIYDQVFVPAIERAGYEAFRVDEDKISDSIINKIFDAVTTYPMALCDLSSRNPNVLYELGLRQAYNLPVVLVKDDVTDKIFDVSGISTVMYKNHRLVENVEKAIEDISEALIQTKEGNIKTLANIVKVRSANYDTIEVGENERIEILLNALANDIKEIKNSQNRGLNEKWDKDRLGSIRFNEINFPVALKDGITIKEIKNVMSQYDGIVTEWERITRNAINVTVNGMTHAEAMAFKNLLEDEL